MSQEAVLTNLYEKLENCGKKEVEIINGETGEFFNVLSFCCNKVCDNEKCQEHRLYKYMRKHKEQIKILNNSMRKPKAWVFTDTICQIEHLTKKYVRYRMTLLYRICKKFSSSEFSIHMEIKLYPYGHKNYGKAYLHFHAVTGGFKKDIHFLKTFWKKNIFYETAIKPKSLTYYVSKYASKTPHFESDIEREFYHGIIYKTLTSRYSITNATEQKPTKFYSLDFILWEIHYTMIKDPFYRSYYNAVTKTEINKKKNKSLSDFG